MQTDQISAADSTLVPSTTIEPTGQTDDIRYVLNKTPPTSEAKAVDGAPEADDHDPRGGLADLVIDDVDGQLPDGRSSTIQGGQVATESKRGAY